MLDFNSGFNSDNLITIEKHPRKDHRFTNGTEFDNLGFREAKNSSWVFFIMAS